MWSKIREASLVICDEINLVPKYVLDAVDLFLRDMMSTDISSGGKTVIIGGDFRQCLLIVQI